MSTSDVVILKRDGEMKAYYVNDIGFRELPEFVDHRSKQSSNRGMQRWLKKGKRHGGLLFWHLSY